MPFDRTNKHFISAYNNLYLAFHFHFLSLKPVIDKKKDHTNQFPTTYTLFTLPLLRNDNSNMDCLSRNNLLLKFGTNCFSQEPIEIICYMAIGTICSNRNNLLPDWSGILLDIIFIWRRRVELKMEDKKLKYLKAGKDRGCEKNAAG